MLTREGEAGGHGESLNDYLTTGEARIIGVGREVEGRRKNGSIVPLELSVSEIELTNRRLFSGIIRDIAERKRTEALEPLQLGILDYLPKGSLSPESLERSQVDAR